MIFLRTDSSYKLNKSLANIIKMIKSRLNTIMFGPNFSINARFIKEHVHGFRFNSYKTRSEVLT